MVAFERVCVVGTGLLGASLALGLRARGYAGKIVGVGRRQATLDRAAALGCFTTLTTDMAHAVTTGSLVVLCSPLSSFPEHFRQLAALGVEGLTLTDVGSVKQSVCLEAQRHLPASMLAGFVGSHPMAGGEKTGPEAAKADLFHGRPCIVTPMRESDAGVVDRVQALWQELGMRVVRLSPDEHDRRVALVSQLPHAVAAALVHLALKDDAIDIASTGFRDTTRVASGDGELWRDIFHDNREQVIRSADEMIEILRVFREMLEKAKWDEMTRWLDEARNERDRWVGGSGNT